MNHIDDAIYKLQRLIGNKPDGTLDPEIRISGLKINPGALNLAIKGYYNYDYIPLTPKMMDYLARALDILSKPLLGKALQIAESDQLACYHEQNRRDDLSKTLTRRSLRSCS